MFSQNLVKAGFRASPKINESRSCVLSYEKLNELLENITSLFNNKKIIIKLKKSTLTFPSDNAPSRSVSEGHQHGEVQCYLFIVLKYIRLQIT